MVVRNSKLQKVLDDPSLLQRFPWWTANQLNLAYYRMNSTEYNPRGQSIFERDWDNLIILDAARYDVFSERNWIDGHLKDHHSLGAGSHEFVQSNFAGRKLNDTVIVTANAFYEKVRQEDGFEIHDIDVVREYQHNSTQEKFVESGRSGWNMPEPITERALEMAEKHPNKRLIVHYHQPHSPYIGETGLEYFDDLPHKLAYKRASEIEVPNDVLRRAYEENLDIAIQEAERLIGSLEGRSVISADHGEMLGERGPVVPIRYYGHMTGLYTKELTRVPWFVVDNGTRKSITAEDSSSPNELDLDEVNNRLQDLGYKL